MICLSRSAMATENDLASHGTVKTILGKEIRAFLGVPYARPPKGTFP